MLLENEIEALYIFSLSIDLFRWMQPYKCDFRVGMVVQVNSK